MELKKMYKYQKMQEKIYEQGKEAAKIELAFNEERRKYCGNEYVSKIQKHDGSCVYQMREAVVEEMLRYWLVIREAVESIYGTSVLSNRIKELTPTQKSVLYLIANARPNELYFQSIKKCYNGSPMMSFYRDEAAQAEQDRYEAERLRIRELWTSF